MNKKGIIYGINGPVIYLKGNTGLRMSEMVHVGEEHLVGEVISLSKKATTVQVFEETTGLKPGAETCVGMVMMRIMKADAIFFSLKSYACTPYAVSAEK